MHIDLVPGMAAHWGGKQRGPGSGFTQEQEKLFKQDRRTIVLPVLPEATPAANRKPKAHKTLWQSIESYFGADEPSQGNQHHAGT